MLCRRHAAQRILIRSQSAIGTEDFLPGDQIGKSPLHPVQPDLLILAGEVEKANQRFIPPAANQCQHMVIVGIPSGYPRVLYLL